MSPNSTKMIENGHSVMPDETNLEPIELNGYLNTAFEDTESPASLPARLSDLQVDRLDAISLYDLNQNKIAVQQFGPSKDAKEKAVAVNEDMEAPPTYETQTAFAVLKQMLLPFMLAGLGSLAAGIVLNHVLDCPAFKEVPQFEVMVPAFLGLIGNIETTLASRLSTHANIGTMDRPSTLRKLIAANFLVVQCQASTVGMFASLVTLVVSSMMNKYRTKITWNSIWLLSSSAVITSVLTNTILSTIICLVVIMGRRLKINPGLFGSIPISGNQ